MLWYVHVHAAGSALFIPSTDGANIMPRALICLLNLDNASAWIIAVSAMYILQWLCHYKCFVFFLFCTSENLEWQRFNKVYIFLLHILESFSSCLNANVVLAVNTLRAAGRRSTFVFGNGLSPGFSRVLVGVSLNKTLNTLLLLMASSSVYEWVC